MKNSNYIKAAKLAINKVNESSETTNKNTNQLKTDKVIDGVLIKAAQPEKGKPYVWPDDVTEIGAYAFAYWKSFNQPFAIPNSVTKIGDSAFYGWTSFNQPFAIPNSVTEIGEYAFCGWNSFNQPNSRRAPESAPGWLRIDDWVFVVSWSGTLSQLRKRLDSESSPKLEKAWKIFSKPLRTQTRISEMKIVWTKETTCDSCDKDFSYEYEELRTYETIYDGELVEVEFVFCPHCGAEVITNS